MSNKVKLSFGSILLLCSLFSAFFAVIIWYESEKQAKQNNIKPCQHWVFNYYYRGRMNRKVMCSDSLYINNSGQYEPIPEHIKKLQEEISEQHRFLLQRMSLVNRDDLSKQED